MPLGLTQPKRPSGHVLRTCIAMSTPQRYNSLLSESIIIGTPDCQQSEVPTALLVPLILNILYTYVPLKRWKTWECALSVYTSLGILNLLLMFSGMKCCFLFTNSNRHEGTCGPQKAHIYHKSLDYSEDQQLTRRTELTQAYARRLKSSQDMRTPF